MSDATDSLTKPQQYVLQRMREGAILRSRPGAGISPWLEIPGTTKVLHVSFITAAGLYDRKLIEVDTRTATVATWKLTPTGQEIDLT